MLRFMDFANRRNVIGHARIDDRIERASMILQE